MILLPNEAFVVVWISRFDYRYEQKICRQRRNFGRWLVPSYKNGILLREERRIIEEKRREEKRGGGERRGEEAD